MPLGILKKLPQKEGLVALRSFRCNSVDYKVGDEFNWSGAGIKPRVVENLLGRRSIGTPDQLPKFPPPPEPEVLLVEEKPVAEAPVVIEKTPAVVEKVASKTEKVEEKLQPQPPGPNPKKKAN